MYDLVVLGGGSGGLSVATAAAGVGARVALIEKGKQVGGGHSASVASKALLHAAKLAHTIRTAGRFGIRVEPPTVDFAAVLERIRTLVQELAADNSDETLRAKGIDVFHGSPAFEAYDTVVVDGKTRVEGQRFVIATGSRPRVPEIPGIADVEILDDASLWNLHDLPETLVILGSGFVAVELAQAFSRLGSKVKLLAETAQILPREDPEISERVEAILAAEGITIKKDVALTRVSVRDGHKLVSFRDRASNDPFEAAGTHILIASGRLANVEGLNLDTVGIHADAQHGIAVDDYLQTNSQRILAIGDVTRRSQFAHAAEREAAVAFQNSVFRLPKKIDYEPLPWTTFTDPEVATVGLLESAARALDPEVLVFRADYAQLDRAKIDGRTDGFAKVVATASGKILGASVVGEAASLILQEFVLAKEQGLSLADIAAAVHTYPTYAGLARNLANQFGGKRLESSVVKTAIRWFRGFKPRGESEVPSEVAGARPAGATHEKGHGH